MTPKAEKLKTFVLEHLDQLVQTGALGSMPQLPNFELFAQDYLEFAEAELIAIQDESNDDNKTARLINCVAHLKRALDCQLDTFLHVHNLYKIFADRNLKIEKKLDFLKAAGIFSSRSLARLNTIRNQMEHSYEIPKISDIEVYYDLVSSFVAVLQRTMILSWNSKIEMNIETSDGIKVGFFTIEYVNTSKPRIKSIWQTEESKETLESDIKNPEEFAFFFKVWLLLYELDSLASTRYVSSQLNP